MYNIQLFTSIVIDIIYELGRLFDILFSYTNNILYFLLISIINISNFFENKYNYMIFKIIIVSILLFFIYRYLIREIKKIMFIVSYFAKKGIIENTEDDIHFEQEIKSIIEKENKLKNELTQIRGKINMLDNGLAQTRKK